jgi:hypothetical protein
VNVAKITAYTWVVVKRYSFRLTNVGQAFARKVSAVLVDAAGHPLGSAEVLDRPLAGR